MPFLGYWQGCTFSGESPGLSDTGRNPLCSDWIGLGPWKGIPSVLAQPTSTCGASHVLKVTVGFAGSETPEMDMGRV